MSDPIEQWTDEDLQRAIGRAWRESARASQDANRWNQWKEPADEAGRILNDDAEHAFAHWKHLKAEVDRRVEVRRQAGIEAHGQCAACSEPNAPGKMLCVGHMRLSSYDPGAEFAPNH